MICNVLATQVEKQILESLISNGVVVDLVVVALLRINASRTKEVLGRALFNLMARADFRQQLVLGGPQKGDLLAAMMELAKIETSGKYLLK